MNEIDEIQKILIVLEDKLSTNFQLKILDNPVNYQNEDKIKFTSNNGCKSSIHNTTMLLEQSFYKKTF